jgi:hypothetical protein
MGGGGAPTGLIRALDAGKRRRVVAIDAQRDRVGDPVGASSPRAGVLGTWPQERPWQALDAAAPRRVRSQTAARRGLVRRNRKAPDRSAPLLDRACTERITAARELS